MSRLPDEKFLCFYTSMPFWTGPALSIDPGGELPKDFRKLMGQIVVREKNDCFQLLIAKDGLLMLQILALEEKAETLQSTGIKEHMNWWSSYLMYANVLYFLLDASMVEVMRNQYLEFSEITTRDAFLATLEDGEIKSSTVAFKSVTALHQLQRLPVQSPLLMFVRARQTIDLPVFDELIRKFTHASRNIELVFALSTIAKAIGELKVGNYSTSLVLSWFVIESKINSMWEKFLAESNTTYPDQRKRISQERKKDFQGRDYPVSVVSNILELSGSVSFDLFSRIDKIRDYRNKVVHRNPKFTCSCDHATDAILLALDLALTDQELKVTPNLACSVSVP